MSEDTDMMFTKGIRHALVLIALFTAGILGFHLFSCGREDIDQETDDIVDSRAETSRDQMSNVAASQPLVPHQTAETTQHMEGPEKHEGSEMGGHDPKSAQLQEISSEFRANPMFRESSAQRILPYLAKGMTAEEIVTLLGEPTDKSSDGSFWQYSVFYSKAIDVYFNFQGTVERIDPVGIEPDK